MPNTTSLTLDRTTALHLPTGTAARALQVDSSYWDHAARQPELADGRLVSVLDYDETWDRWERHPVGEELVYVLSGAVELLLDDGSGEHAVALSAGQGLIVPEGTWHRAVIDTPSRMLFITPTPARTENRPVGGG